VNPGYPQMSLGPIRPEQMRTLADLSFRTRAVSFLRRELPAQTEGMTNLELDTLVGRAMETGRAMDLTSERELVRWSVVGLLTHGAAFEDKQLRLHIESYPPDPDRVGALLAKLSEELKRQR
jgi:hypothetical protein